jgi:hypothetical protein
MVLVEKGRISPAGKDITKERPKWNLGVDWRPDALRHSYASYRLAITEDAPSLSLEMGNSPAMIFKHYLDLKHKEEGEAWFSLEPDGTESA